MTINEIKGLVRRPVGINLEPVPPERITGGYRGRVATIENAQRAVELGADSLVLTGNPGSGVTGTTILRAIEEIGTVDLVRERGKLALTAIGTSQEGADEGTVRQIALMNKMTGADIHHIGDAGYGGMAIPENIMAFSIAIKGRRHTYRRGESAMRRG